MSSNPNRTSTSDQPDDFRSSSLDKLDDFAVLSGVWILASNDDNSIITYASVRYRLGLSEMYPLEELVARRGELFRRGVRADRLEAWKTDMRQGKHLPSWVRSLSEEERERYLKRLAPEDCFRSQFRTGEKARRSDVEIIEWGLKHIDRLRDLHVRSGEEKMHRWSTLWIPLLSTTVALVAVFGGMVQGSMALRAQANLKSYELSFAPKQQSYGRFMRAHLAAYEAAVNRDERALGSANGEANATYYDLEPFLDDSVRTAVRAASERFLRLCSLRSTGADSLRTSSRDTEADSVRRNLERMLFRALFRDRWQHVQ